MVRNDALTAFRRRARLEAAGDRAVRLLEALAAGDRLPEDVRAWLREGFQAWLEGSHDGDLAAALELRGAPNAYKRVQRLDRLARVALAIGPPFGCVVADKLECLISGTTAGAALWAHLPRDVRDDVRTLRADQGCPRSARQIRRLLYGGDGQVPPLFLSIGAP